MTSIITKPIIPDGVDISNLAQKATKVEARLGVKRIAGTDISTNTMLEMDIPSLPTSPSALSGDFFTFVDSSGVHHKIAKQNILPQFVDYVGTIDASSNPAFPDTTDLSNGDFFLINNASETLPFNTVGGLSVQNGTIVIWNANTNQFDLSSISVLPTNQTIVSTDNGNILIEGSDGGAYLEQTQYQLPAPFWESIETLYLQTPILDDRQIDGFYQVGATKWSARVPLIDQKLIDDGEVFVEFGRLRGKQRRKRNNGDIRMQGRRIRWYSNWVNGLPINSGYSGGQHGVSLDRPNMFPVTNQGFITPPLPWNTFYKMVECSYYNGDFSNNNPILLETVPKMMGTSISKVSSVVLVGINPNRVKNNQLRDIVRSSSERYARLVIKKDGKVIQQGPHSEPLFLERSGLPYRDERERVYAFSNSDINALITIGHKYKQ